MRGAIVGVVLGAIGVGTAHAQSIVALVGDNALHTIDARALKVTRSSKVEGVPGRILGIDVRPADGVLYALATDGTLWTVDPATGKATQKSKLDMTPPRGT